MNSGQALLIFLGIPAAFAALVAILVFAGAWTRSGRAPGAAAPGGWESGAAGGALFIATSAALPDPARLTLEIGSMSTPSAGGGAHGSW